MVSKTINILRCTVSKTINCGSLTEIRSQKIWTKIYFLYVVLVLVAPYGVLGPVLSCYCYAVPGMTA